MSAQIRFLFFSLISLPIAAYFLGEPPNPLQWSLLTRSLSILGVAIAYSFIVGQLSGNYSQVDKLWSLLPVVYVWYFTLAGGLHERMILLSVLVTLWGARLTYNFGRKGAYHWKFWAGEEDYRWKILRERPGFRKPWVWLLFNLFFICIYQHALIWMITLPLLGSLSADAMPLYWADYLLAFLFCVFLVLETIADQQQFNFQTEKYRRIKAGEPLGVYAPGFVSSGLWAYVRHPNYSAEQAIWIIVYLFSVAANGTFFNWSMTGAVLLILLFKGSSDFSESISSSKYPLYASYQQRLPRFIPFLK